MICNLDRFSDHIVLNSLTVCLLPIERTVQSFKALFSFMNHWIISYDTRWFEFIWFVVYAIIYYITEQAVVVLNFQ